MVDLLIQVARRSVKLTANGWEGKESIRQNLIVVYHYKGSIFLLRFEATDSLNVIIFIVIIIILVVTTIIISIFDIAIIIIILL